MNKESEIQPQIAHPFKRFKVVNLWGERTFTLNISDDCIILLGENGTGKSTILSMFYYLIKGDFKKLSEYKFDEIQLVLASGKEIRLSKNDLSFDRERGVIERLKGVLHPEELFEVWTELRNARYHHVGSHSYKDTEFMTHRMLRMLRSTKDVDIDSEMLKQFISYVKRFDTPEHLINNFMSFSQKDFMKGYKVMGEMRERLVDLQSFEIIYFPTFRKIEIESHELGIKIDKGDKITFDSGSIIEFGMDDVKNRIKRILNNIKENTLGAYKGLNEVFLTHLAHISDREDSNIDIEHNELDILLNRLSEKIENKLIEHIKDLFKTNKIYHKENRTLLFFLSKLHQVYKQDKEKESAVEQFSEKCNSYFEDKCFEFDKRRLTLTLRTKKEGRELDLKQLSSGEKQIVTMFSRMYLGDPERKKIVLIDEPELSLSITWQEKFLQDVLNSGNCVFLFSVTHSPFMTQNHKLIEKLVNIKTIRE